MSLDDLPIALGRVGEAGRILEMNAAFAALVGRSAWPERLGELFPAEEQSRLAAAFESPASPVDLSGLREDGFPFRILFRAVLSGSEALIVGDAAPPPLFDQESASQAPLPEKGEVDAALSHDVRGALRGVSGFLGLLEREVDFDDETQGYVETIRRSATAADEMSKALVRWLRLLLSPVVLEPLSLDEVVADAAERAGSTLVLEAGEGAVALPQISADGLPTVLAERVLLTEAIAELIVNAGRFCEDGVEIEATAETADGWCRVRFRDNGLGIEPKLAEDAFKLFRLLQPKGRYPGLGMGLPLSRRMIEVQGGRLWVEPDPPPGAVLVARLAAVSDG